MSKVASTQGTDRGEACSDDCGRDGGAPGRGSDTGGNLWNRLSRPGRLLAGSGYCLAAGLLALGVQGQTNLGDLTGDQEVDLRDALRAFRIAEGQLPETAADLAAGDVFPNPGVGNRTVGDGQLTRDDAHVLLRHAAGLIPLDSVQTQTALNVAPNRANVGAGGQQSFTASLADGGPVDWSVEVGSGSIDANGNFTAPGTVTGEPITIVRATSQRDPRLSGFATVQLVSGNAVRVTREQAAAIVEREVIALLPRPDQAIALGLPEPVRPSDRLRPAFPAAIPEGSEGGPGEPSTPTTDRWFFLIDEAPLTAWAHPVRYIFVDVHSGQIAAEQFETWYPTLNGAPFWHRVDSVLDAPELIHRGIQVADLVSATNPAALSALNGLSASARVRPADNVPESMFAPAPHQCPCETSTRRFALIAVMSPEEERLLESGELMRQEFSQSGFTTTLIQALRKSDFVSAMAPYRTELRPCDVLVVMLLGHGAAGSCGAVSAGDVADAFEMIPTNAKYFLVEACDAGAAPEIFNLRERAGLVPRAEILTASDEAVFVKVAGRDRQVPLIGQSPIWILGEGTGFTSALRSCFGRVDRLEEAPECMTSVTEIGPLALRMAASGPRFARVGSPDSDQDALLDAREAILGTDPRLPDSDGDGVCDSIEWSRFPDPFPPRLELIFPPPSEGVVLLPRARVGSPYSIQMLHNDGLRTMVQPGTAGPDNPFGAAAATGWSVEGDSPTVAGLQLNRITGALEGIPTQPGRFTFTIQYQDVLGARLRQQVHVDIFGDSPLRGATITVNSAKDDNVRDDELTLREAVLLARGLLQKSELKKQGSGPDEPGEEHLVNGDPGRDFADFIAVDSSIDRIQLEAHGLPSFILDSPADSINAGTLVARSAPVFVFTENGAALTATILGPSDDPDPIIVMEGEHNSFNGSITNAGGTGIHITGDHNRVTASVENAAGSALHLDGCSGNQINGRRSSGSRLHGNAEGIRLSGGASANQIGVFANSGRGPITITGSRSHGVVIAEQSHANVFEQLVLGSADQPNSGHGFLVADGSGNRIINITASGNAGGGIVVEGANSTGNVFLALSSSLSEHGVILAKGAASNRVETALIRNNRRHGVLLADPGTRANLINFSVIRDQGGDGVRLEGGASENWIGRPTGSREITGCAGNGLAVLGAGTADNRLGHFINIADCGQAGLLFGEGARRNRFERGSIRACGVGLRFDGAGTDDNVAFDVRVADNRGDGVHLSGGCQFNQVSGADSPDPAHSRHRATWIGGNQGNGVTFIGPNTSGNSLIRCLVGAGTTPIGPRADQAHGIEVREGAHGNFVIDCVVVDHRLTGVRLHGVGTRENRFENLIVFGNPAASGPGVQMEAGAQANVFLSGEIGPNGGDGVRILGAETQGNALSGLLIGVGKTEVPLMRHFPIKRVINGILQLQLLTNSGAGIHIENAVSNIIGSSSGPGNTIANNDLDGVRITGPQATRNQVVGNFIGTDDTGTQRLPNRFQGVLVDGQARDNSIGGARHARSPHSPHLLLAPDVTRLGGGNLIAANSLSGVRLAGVGAVGNRVLGNVIGWTAGVQSLGNGGDGVTISEGASGNCVGNCASFGANDPALANVIRRNSGAGVLVVGSQTVGNSFAQNVIFENSGPDVLLVDNANGGIPTPTINSFSSNTGRLVGTAGSPGIVEVFSANDGTFLASAQVRASPFTLDLFQPAASVNATFLELGAPIRSGAVKITHTDATGNTSAYSSRVGRSRRLSAHQEFRTTRPAGEPLPIEGPGYVWRAPPNGIRLGGVAAATIESRAFPDVRAVLYDLTYDSTRLSLESVRFLPRDGDTPLAAALPELFPIRAGALRMAALFTRPRQGNLTLAECVFRALPDAISGEAFVALEPMAALSPDLEFISVAGSATNLVVLAAPEVSYAGFRRQHWPADTPDSIAGPAADPDGDGLANFTEYALSLDPTAASRAGLPQVAFVDAAGERFGAVSYLRPLLASDVLYEIFASPSLAGPNWDQLTEVFQRTESNDRETIVIRDSVPEPSLLQRFYLLRVTPR